MTNPLNPDVLAIVDMMDTILERVVGGYSAAGVELPARQYWTCSQPPADCEQVVVFFNQAYIGPPGDEANFPQRCNSPRTAQLDVQVIRCVPTPINNGRKAPEPAAIQEASKKQAIDAWLLLDLASNFDTWDGDLPGIGLGVIATIDVAEPQGAFQSVTLHLTVAIP